MKKSFFVAMGMVVFVIVVLYGVTKIISLLQKMIETAIETTVSFWHRVSIEDIFLVVFMVMLLQFISWIRSRSRRRC